jgi:hypothetical protein
MKYINLLFICLIVSCGQNNYEGDIKMLDSLRKKVVNVQEDFNSLDSIPFVRMGDEIQLKIQALKTVYMPDSVNIPIETTVNKFAAYRNYKAAFNLQRLRIKKEIPYTLNQLEHLVTDLKNNALNSEDAVKYIEIEKKAAEELFNTFKKLKQHSIKKTAEFDSLKLVMDTFIDSLSSDSVNVQAIRLKLLKSRTKRR